MPVGVSAGSCHSAFCQLVPPRCHTSSSHTSSPVTHRKSMCLRHSEAKRWEFGAEKGLLPGLARRWVAQALNGLNSPKAFSKDFFKARSERGMVRCKLLGFGFLQLSL